MIEDLYCEPCRRFLCGEVTIPFYYEGKPYKIVSFEHHDSLESFEKAMKLPCAICTKAWSGITTLPTVHNWTPITGAYYFDDDERCLYFVTGKASFSSRLFFEPWEHMGDYHVPDTLPLSTQSDAAIDFLVDKYQECRMTHEGCNNTTEVGSENYPSRLLDVGTDDHDSVILRSTHMFCDEEYACLSHCWGDANVLRLDAKSQTALATGISTTLLSKTFRDAIVVTRRLHVQFLWIDSLCILQDSATDWEKESARMGHIYSRAAFTIAATASWNGNGGLFFKRDPRAIIPRRVNVQFRPSATWGGGHLAGSYWFDVQCMVEHCIEDAPLNLRAWVSQERQLSRRVLHFSDSQLFWECHGLMACETYPGGLPKSAQSSWAADPNTLKKASHHMSLQNGASSEMDLLSLPASRGLDFHTYLAWCSFRQQYSNRDLTRESDKLVALHGIAQQMSDLTGDACIAGLWRSRIIEELCWVKLRKFRRQNQSEISPQRASTWRAPTWSWASSDGLIWVNTLTSIHGEHPSRSFEAELVDLHVSAKKSGELEEAWMDIKCRPLPAIFVPTARSRFEEPPYDGSLTLIDHDLKALQVVPEFGANLYLMSDGTNIDERLHGYVVIIQVCLHGQDDPNYEHTDTVNQGEDEKGTKERTEEVEDDDHDDDDDDTKQDVLEALFLHREPRGQGYYTRAGLLFAQGHLLVQQILEIHRSTESQVITLV